MNTEILNKLPSSWDTFKLKDYKKTLSIKINESKGIEELFDGGENTIKVLSAITDMPIDYFEYLPLNELALYTQRIAFMNTLPDTKSKSVMQWKDYETVSYNDYVLFSQHSANPWEYITELIQAFSTNKLSKEEIDNLSMNEIYTGFFLLKIHTKKFVRRTIKSTSKHLMRIQTKNLYHLIRGKTKFRKKKD